MLNLFKKNPIKKLEQQQDQLLSKAYQAQSNGNIKLFSELSFEAQEIQKQIDSLKNLEGDQ